MKMHNKEHVYVENATDGSPISDMCKQQTV